MARLMSGLAVTIKIALVAVVLSLIFGVIFGIIMTSRRSAGFIWRLSALFRFWCGCSYFTSDLQGLWASIWKVSLFLL